MTAARRLVAVPRTRAAMERLDYDRCIEGDLWEFELPDRVLDDLWPLFETLNQGLGTLIDFYEDEEIVDPALLERGRVLLAEQADTTSDPHISKLLAAFEKAEQWGTGVFFFF